MPIRTHRGRAAVYRKFWGWPVRSPRHLAGTALVAVVIALGFESVLPTHRDAPGPAAPSVRPPTGSSAPRSALSHAGLARQPLVAAPTSSAPAAALTVARSWVQQFLTTPKGITSARWVEQLRPYTTDDLFPELQSIDPANVPAAQIINQPRTVSVGPGSAEVDVPTTAVVIRLLLVATPAGWRVASYEQTS